MFGGVCDKDGDEEIDSDSEGEGDEESAMFYNELYSIHFDGERATWSLVKYTGSEVIIPFTHYFNVLNSFN